MKLKAIISKIKANRKYFLYGAILIVVFIAITGILIPENNQKDLPVNTSKPTTVKRQPILTPPTSNTLQSSDVEIDNFYRQNPPINSRGDALISKTPLYQIYYFSVEDQFLISILDKDFENIRKIAEQDLIRTLNIDEQVACRLDIIETTPNFVNPEKSGGRYGFSTCN